METNLLQILIEKKTVLWIYKFYLSFAHITVLKRKTMFFQEDFQWEWSLSRPSAVLAAKFCRSWWSDRMHYISRLDKSTYKPFYSYKLCTHNDPQHLMGPVECTCVALPCHNLEKCVHYFVNKNSKNYNSYCSFIYHHHAMFRRLQWLFHTNRTHKAQPIRLDQLMSHYSWTDLCTYPNLLAIDIDSIDAIILCAYL